IAVDHDGLKARIAKRKRSVATAIVKLDSLPDPIRPGAEDHDLASIGRRRFAFAFVSRVEIRSERLELGAASVDAFVNRNHAETLSMRAHFVFRFFSQVSKTAIGERYLLERTQKLGRDVLELSSLDVLLNFHHVLKLFQEPGVDAR